MNEEATEPWIATPRRYGFHGISHKYFTLRYGQITNRPVNELRLITLHLEGGSSAAAIRGGKSVDTSMGFTPLEGLMMGTRCGDIDPALFIYLMRKENLEGEDVEKLLNKRCGLLGVSGVSADTRELMQHRDQEQVELALNMFCYRIRKYIGAYLAALGGAEAIVFGGGIGETPHWCGSASVRISAGAALTWTKSEMREQWIAKDRLRRLAPPCKSG